MKSWVHNDIEMYSTHKEGKYVLAERFIRTLNNKIYKYMTAVSKNVYLNNLTDTLNKYNNTYHSTIKTKPVESSQEHILISNNENDREDPKFEVGRHVRY